MSPLNASAEASPTVRTRDVRAAAVIAGAGTLAMAVFGIFGNVAIITLIGDGATGVSDRIADGALLLRGAIVAFLIVAILDVVLAWAIMRFFGATRHGGLPVLAGWLRVAYAAVLAAAVGSLGVALSSVSATGGDPDAAYPALVAFQSTWQFGLIVFAAHLVVLGALLVRDAATPTWLGSIIVTAGCSYAFDGVARVFLEQHSPVLLVSTVAVAATSIVGEVGLGLWFLTRGGRQPAARHAGRR